MRVETHHCIPSNKLTHLCPCLTAEHMSYRNAVVLVSLTPVKLGSDIGLVSYMHFMKCCIGEYFQTYIHFEHISSNGLSMLSKIISLAVYIHKMHCKNVIHFFPQTLCHNDIFRVFKQSVYPAI